MLLFVSPFGGCFGDFYGQLGKRRGKGICNDHDPWTSQDYGRTYLAPSRLAVLLRILSSLQERLRATALSAVHKMRLFVTSYGERCSQYIQPVP